jgi:hypothetical protein
MASNGIRHSTATLVEYRRMSLSKWRATEQRALHSVEVLHGLVEALLGRPAARLFRGQHGPQLLAALGAIAIKDWDLQTGGPASAQRSAAPGLARHRSPEDAARARGPRSSQLLFINV